MTQYILISFQIALFITFITVIWRRYGVLDSISDSWYSLGEHKNAAFTLFLWGIALPMAILGGLQNNVWYFFAGAFLCFTGAAADFKESLTGAVHGVGAAGGITLALAGLTISGLYWPIAVVLISSLAIRYSKIPNQTWWVECAAFVIIEAGLLYNLIK